MLPSSKNATGHFTYFNTVLSLRTVQATAQLNGQRYTGIKTWQLELWTRMQLVHFLTPNRTKEYPTPLVNLYLSALGLLCHNKVAAARRVAFIF